MLTEPEIFDRMRTSLREAIEACDVLVGIPAQGPTYVKLRENLKLVEGCCRQAAHWREDSRWLQYGLMMEDAHQRSLNWLRYRNPRWLFGKLGEALRGLMKQLDDLKDKAPPKLGTILPEPVRDPSERAPHIVVPEMPKAAKAKRSIIIPPGVTIQ